MERREIEVIIDPETGQVSVEVIKGHGMDCEKITRWLTQAFGPVTKTEKLWNIPLKPQQAHIKEQN